MKPKGTRIAIVAASAPPLSSGGVASAHYNLFRALKSRGYQVKLFTFFDNSIPAGFRETTIVRNGTQPWIAKLIRMGVRTLFKLVEPRKQTYQAADILCSSVGAIKMSRAITRFNPDAVVLSDHGAPGLWISKKPGQLFILVSHHNPLRFAKEPALGNFSLKDAELAVWLENRVLRKADCVICPSRYIYKWFRTTYSYHGPVRVVPNVMDFQFTQSIRPKKVQKILGRSSRAKAVYLPSAGVAIKGARFIWPIIEKILKAVPDLVFYMPGEVEPEVRTRIEEYGNGRFYLPGQVEYKRHLSLVKACDIGISPAIMENFSMAILEGAALGVPMLAFKRGGNEDVIKDGKNGYLITAFDVEELAQTAKRLLKSRNLARFKKSAAKFTQRRFPVNSTVNAYLACMELAET